MTGLQANAERDNYYGTTVTNKSAQYIPEHILEASVRLKQMLIDANLKVTITVSN